MDGCLAAALPHFLDPADGQVERTMESQEKPVPNRRNIRLALILGGIALFFFVAIMVIQASHY